MEVVVFGTFDHLHPGHLDLFRQARVYGDILTVIVARDENVLRFKGRRPENSEKQRLRAVLKASGVNRARLGYKRDMYKILKEIRPQVVCLGYDQKADLKMLEQKLQEYKVSAKIVRLNPFHPEKYKSSLYHENTDRHQQPE